MAKKKITTHKFYVVDLVRRKPATTYIEIPVYRVDITIDVTTTGLFSASAVPSAALKRLEDAARGELERYEDVIASEAARLDKKIGQLMETPTPKAQDEAERLIQGVNASIKNALASAEGAAMKAVEARLKKEIQADKNLSEARVKTTLKVTLGIIKISGSVAKLVGTLGSDVTSYVTIVSEVVTLGLEINQQIKNEEKLRKDLYAGVQAYITLRGTTIMQAAQRQLTDTSGIEISRPIDAIKTIAGKVKTAGTEVSKSKDAKTVANEVMDFVIKGVKSKLNDAEKARTAYREHTTKTRHKTDSLSAKADKMQVALKKAKNLKEGVKLGAEMMGVKRAISALAVKLVAREKFLDEMQSLMKLNGLEIDDRTAIQKIQALDKLTIASEGGELVSALSTIRGTIQELAKLAG